MGKCRKQPQQVKEALRRLRETEPNLILISHLQTICGICEREREQIELLQKHAQRALELLEKGP